ncbi:hypothetical protein TIFTF001_006635 [Ficus carica]|uniref:Uncharacterized protein n=1 Tax=Ficus carica TaxID=3494 RepID=A0AA88A4L5_FICCA|nr:hypothetical protein TIFTF001_006635 [Ficus carica]
MKEKTQKCGSHFRPRSVKVVDDGSNNLLGFRTRITVEIVLNLTRRRRRVSGFERLVIVLDGQENRMNRPSRIAGKSKPGGRQHELFGHRRNPDDDDDEFFVDKGDEKLLKSRILCSRMTKFLLKERSSMEISELPFEPSEVFLGMTRGGLAGKFGC